jgi:flagellar biosynthesis/type III secretory pathway protein FliH
MRLSSNIYKSAQVVRSLPERTEKADEGEDPIRADGDNEVLSFTPEQYRSRMREIETDCAKKLEEVLSRKWEAEYARRIAALENMVKEMTKKHSSVIDYYGSFLTSLTMEVVTRIVRKEISVDPSFVCRSLKDAVAGLMRSGRMLVRIHPDDRGIVESAFSEWKLNGQSSPKVELEDDSAIQKGGCRIESELGGVDATIETQLAQFERFLNEIYDNARKTV